jgi:uncharacterized protein YjbI with pentapeptide repeats
MAEALEDFRGNDKHYKVLRKALLENDIGIWNTFASSMGPRFRADLRGMLLTGCNLAGARLAGARLDGACLDEADLTGTDLTGASLVGATLRDAKLDQTKMKTPARVVVKIKTSRPDTAQLDPDARRRLKIERSQEAAREFLEERAKKEAAQERQRAQIKARNNPSPFSRDE